MTSLRDLQGEQLRDYLVSHARKDEAPARAVRGAIAGVTAVGGSAAVGIGTATAAASVSVVAAKWIVLGAIAGTLTVSVGETVRRRHTAAPAPPSVTVVAAPAVAVATAPSVPDIAPLPAVSAPSVRAPARRAAVDDNEDLVIEEAAPLASAPAPSDLARELALLEQVRNAMVQRDAPAALAALTRYDRDVTAGKMVSEAAALRVEALVLAGRREEARARADAFLATYPRSPLVDRVRRAVER